LKEYGHLKSSQRAEEYPGFLKEKIPDDLIDKLMEALIWAPRVSKKEAVEVIE